MGPIYELLAHCLTELLGNPETDDQGRPVWDCWLDGVRARVALARRTAESVPALHILDGPNHAPLPLSFLRYIEIPTLQAAESILARFVSPCERAPEAEAQNRGQRG